MPDMLEIRWHGRGGQGAKTAALLLAEVLSAAGKYVQGFPEYGPERMGAPVLAFNRISDVPISVHSHVTEPDIVVVLDETLVGKNNVTEGLKGNDAIIIVNSGSAPEALRKKLKLEGGRVFAVDASHISMETLGRNLPNTPMIGALVRATELMDFQAFADLIRSQLEDKFKGKKDMVSGNAEAIERAYREVRGECEGR